MKIIKNNKGYIYIELIILILVFNMLFLMIFTELLFWNNCFLEFSRKSKITGNKIMIESFLQKKLSYSEFLKVETESGNVIRNLSDKKIKVKKILFKFGDTNMGIYMNKWSKKLFFTTNLNYGPGYEFGNYVSDVYLKKKSNQILNFDIKFDIKGKKYNHQFDLIIQP